MNTHLHSLLTVEEAMAFVQQHGVVLVSAKGNVPNLVEAIVGSVVKGSWWVHPEGNYLYATMSAVTASEEVLACRLVDGKVTLVHRNLWPSLVRLANRFAPERLARLREEHTASGRHAKHAEPFPTWVPPAVATAGSQMSEQEALSLFGAWLPPKRQRSTEPRNKSPLLVRSHHGA